MSDRFATISHRCQSDRRLLPLRLRIRHAIHLCAARVTHRYLSHRTNVRHGFVQRRLGRHQVAHSRRRLIGNGSKTHPVIRGHWRVEIVKKTQSSGSVTIAASLGATLHSTACPHLSHVHVCYWCSRSRELPIAQASSESESAYGDSYTHAHTHSSLRNFCDDRLDRIYTTKSCWV